MDTRKVTLVATIAVIALVAVGIGYAYTAITTNTDNNADIEYLTIVQGGDGAYQFAPADNEGHNQKIVWDTADYRSGTVGNYTYNTKFSLTEVSSTTEIPGYTIVQVGNSFTLKVTPENATVENLEADIIAENFVVQTEISTGNKADILLRVTTDGKPTQMFKLTDGDALPDYFQKGTINPSTGAFTPAGNNKLIIYADDSIQTPTSFLTSTVTVFYGYIGTDGIIATRTNPDDPAPAGPSSTPIDNATLKFKISNNVVNQGVALTSLTVDGGASATVSVGEDVVKTITYTPTSATYKAITATSSNIEKATVTVNGNKVTIHGVAAGSATVTVSGDNEKSVEITVTVN